MTAPRGTDPVGGNPPPPPPPDGTRVPPPPPPPDGVQASRKGIGLSLPMVGSPVHFVPATGDAEIPGPGPYPATVTGVVDADTVHLAVLVAPSGGGISWLARPNVARSGVAVVGGASWDWPNR